MKSTIVLLLVIISGFAAQFGLSRFLESNQVRLSPEAAEEDLYFAGGTIKKVSLGFDGVIADYYWMSALQYMGRKFMTSGENVKISLDDLSGLNPRLLYPMLDTATTLDPQLEAAYAYGATVLPAIDVEQAIKICEKGVAANPDNWLMYHRLGYIYWKKREFAKAAEVYANGAAKLNAPAWMNQMSARLQGEGGSRSLAREMYSQMLASASDTQTKEMLANRLLQIDAFDERDAIKSALQNFQQTNNRCPQNWRELAAELKTARTSAGKNLRTDTGGAPLDPSDAPYLLDTKNGKCGVELNLTSQIPYQ